MDRTKQREAANAAVHQAINHMIAYGHDEQDLSDMLLGYALSIMTVHHEKIGVARHLYALALKFADPDQDPLNGRSPVH